MRRNSRPRRLPPLLARFVTRPEVSVRRDWLAIAVQALVAVGTIGLAIAALSQIKQASRAAAAAERTNLISMAVARLTIAPRYAVPVPRIDSGRMSSGGFPGTQ
jgi:hypothetical protein